MLKTAVILLSLLSVAGCGTAPAPTRADDHPFTVISEQADAVASNLTMLIKVTGPATQQNVKSIVESIMANRKDEYRHILVKSYAEVTPASDVPFAVSRLENGSVTHRFNSLTESQRIPTH